MKAWNYWLCCQGKVLILLILLPKRALLAGTGEFLDDFAGNLAMLQKSPATQSAADGTWTVIQWHYCWSIRGAPMWLRLWSVSLLCKLTHALAGLPILHWALQRPSSAGLSPRTMGSWIPFILWCETTMILPEDSWEAAKKTANFLLFHSEGK